MLDRNPRAHLPSPEGHQVPAPHVSGVGPYSTQSYGYGTSNSDDEISINPLDLLVYFVRYRWLIFTFIAAGIIAGLMVTWMLTPHYRATTKLEIMVPSARVFQDLEVVSEVSDFRNFLTAAEKLKSRVLAQRVVFELGLADKPDFVFPDPNFAISNLLARAFGMRIGEKKEDFTAEELEAIAIKNIQDGLKVDLIRNTSLLAVTYSSQKPEYASAVANQLVASFIDQRVDQTSETSVLARQFIQEQVLQVKERLQESEQKLVDYAKEQGITSTGDEKSLIRSNIDTINKALAEAIQERLDYGRLVAQIESGDADSLPQVIDSDGISRMREKVAELSAEYQQKLATFKPQFPEMLKLSAQIKEMNRQIDRAVNSMANTVKIRFEEALTKESDLRREMQELEAEQAEYQDKNIQYTILKREVDSNRSQYETLIGKLNDVGVGAELRNQNVAVVDAAVLPVRPYSPRLALNLAAAVAIAMILAAVLIYLLELLNNTFSNPDQIESELKLSVLGILPNVDDSELVEQLSDQRSAISEAYRSLRTALQFTGADGAPRTILVTSSEPSEGKSTTAFKLAQDFGALGARVLIIDADLRKPNLHRLFKVNNVLGLSNVLANTIRKSDAKNIFRKTDYENVMVMTAGTIPPNPADLLSSPRMGTVISSCLEPYDLIIFDGPPIVGLADAPILSRMVETTLMVVSADQVTRKAAKTALNRLKSAGGVVAGAAFSKFEVNRFEYNYAYKYMSYQYHTYGNDTRKLTDGSGEQVDPNSASTLLQTIGARFRSMSERANRLLYRNQ